MTSEAARPRPITATDLWAIPRVGTPAVAADGSFLVVGVTTYAPTPDGNDEARQRLWLVRTRGGASPRPLTAPDVSSSSPAVSPDGKHVAFVRKPAKGGEQPVPQLYVMPLDGGEAQKLTDLPLGVADPRWLPDASAIVVRSSLYRGALDVAATRRLFEERAKAGVRPQVTEDRVYRFWDTWLTDGEVPHLFLVDVPSGATRDLTPTSERWFDLMDADGEYDVSPDGLEIVWSANATEPPFTEVRAALYTAPIAASASGDPTCITHGEVGDLRRPRYSPDGRCIVYGARRDVTSYSDRVRVVRYDRATGAHVTLTEEWDRSAGAWELAGPDTALLEVDERGRTQVYALDLTAPGREPRKVARGGALHGLRPVGGVVYAQSHGLAQPPEIVRFPLAGGEVEPVTTFAGEALSAIAFGRVEELEIAGADGDPVHVFLVFPPGYEAGAPRPLVQVLHGGPYGMHGDLWSFRWNAQTFAAPGHVVAMVNFHGSAGYGSRFADSVMGNWGGAPAEDILLATDALVARGVADPARLALAGGSYGGYLAAWLPTRTDRFRCTVVHAPVFNTGTLCSGDMTQGVERELGGEPWSMPATREPIDRWNPAMHTASYTTPTLVTHGGKDYRCPVENGFELYGVLKAKGVSARLAHYPDEGHWILKRRHSIHWYGEVLGWIGRHLA